MKISVIGAGYVGLSLAVLISRQYEVVAVDVIPEKVNMINSGTSPIADKGIQDSLHHGNLNLRAVIDINEVRGSEIVIIATPTNYDSETHYFNTASVESVVFKLQSICPDATVVIKSTVPIGFTEKLCQEHSIQKLLYSPEFLREGNALYDNLHPSRIIVGIPGCTNLNNEAHRFSDILSECSEEENVEKLIIGSTEAESIKLFSNTYLAMRVAFFNELDSFAESNNLNSRDIIKGVSMDPRIGDWYNNPSFGYGGYCLPKDTKQLLANYDGVPNSLMKAIVESNNVRKAFVTNSIIERVGKGKTIGIYRLIMKTGSDNFRESSVIDVMDGLKKAGLTVVVYEPMIQGSFNGFPVIDDIYAFIKRSDLIVSNRFSKEIESCKDKVYCRDLFRKD